MSIIFDAIREWASQASNFFQILELHRAQFEYRHVILFCLEVVMLCRKTVHVREYEMVRDPQWR